MKSISKLFGAAAIIASVSLAPLAHAQQQAGGMDMKGMMKEGGMMSSMPKTGNPDVDFATMMREHHKGALSMAEAELKNGKDAGMRDMAKKIIAAQKKEIAQFDAFLAKSGSGQAGRSEAPAASEKSSAGAAAPAPATFTEAEVRKVDKDAKKITLKHDEIKNLEMPGMTMVFAVKDEAMLDKVKAGDKVQFKAVNDGGKLTVVEIQTAK